MRRTLSTVRRMNFIRKARLAAILLLLSGWTVILWVAFAWNYPWGFAALLVTALVFYFKWENVL